ncbi:Uncharacterised protein g3104 [Pycnogonum litorale]
MELRKCLNDAKTLSANAVGILFFNILAIKCVKEERPQIRCIKYGGLLDLSCQEYQLNWTAPKEWALFDQPIFIPSKLNRS